MKEILQLLLPRTLDLSSVVALAKAQTDTARALTLGPIRHPLSADDDEDRLCLTSMLTADGVSGLGIVVAGATVLADR